MDIRGKRLLVVGGAGFIGSHTIDELVKEDVKEIRVFDNFSRGKMENLRGAMTDPRVTLYPAGGELLHADVLQAATQGIDGVFHFAAMWLLHCWEFPASAFDVNIRGTFNVAEACANSSVKRLVFSSSASVYGDAVTEPMTEDHPFNNNTFYGASKIAGEQIVRAHHHRYLKTENRFDYVALRYFNVYGPRQDDRCAYVAVIMKMLDRIDKGLPPILHGDGSQAYDFIYVGDCARANVCAMKADATDRAYNVATGKKTSLRELASTVFAVLGKEARIQYEPQTQSFVKNRLGSTARATEEIGFTAKNELRQGIEELVKWRASHIEEVEQRRREAGLPAEPP